MSARSEIDSETQRPYEVSIPALLEHPFVAGLKMEHVRRLAETSMLSNFKANEVILTVGDTANRFYLIRSGSVAVEWPTRGRTTLIQVIGAGDVLGWSWMFAPYSWRFTARALESTQAIFFYATPLRDECEADHDFGYELMKRAAAVMLERLQSTRRRLVQAELAQPVVGGLEKPIMEP